MDKRTYEPFHNFLSPEIYCSEFENSKKKYQYDIKLISQPFSISEEENNDLYTQDWKAQNIIITEQNLVLFKLENNRYSSLFQIIDVVGKNHQEIFQVEDIIVLSFYNVGYIFEIPRVK